MSDALETDPSETAVRRAIRRGGEWFLANQNDQFLHYRYDPIGREWAEARHAARELATLWAVAKLASFLDDARFEALAKRGFDCFLPSVMHEPQRDLAVVAITPRRIKLNYSAFMMLALLEHPIPGREETLAQLARGVMSLQQPDGHLRTFFNTLETSGTDFYPGQAMLALMALHEATGEPAYLRCVERAFPYYRSYWRADPTRAFVPWHSQALSRLYRATGNPDIADFVFEMNDELAAGLTHEAGPELFDFSSGAVVAVYIEGLNQAFRLAQDFGDRQRAARYATLVRHGAEAVMALQCPTAEQNEADFDAPAIGGFFLRPDELEMRIDHNQHAVMALMGACEVGLLR